MVDRRVENDSQVSWATRWTLPPFTIFHPPARWRVGVKCTKFTDAITNRPKNSITYSKLSNGNGRMETGRKVEAVGRNLKWLCKFTRPVVDSLIISSLNGRTIKLSFSYFICCFLRCCRLRGRCEQSLRFETPFRKIANLIVDWNCDYNKMGRLTRESTSFIG